MGGEAFRIAPGAVPKKGLKTCWRQPARAPEMEAKLEKKDCAGAYEAFVSDF